MKLKEHDPQVSTLRRTCGPLPLIATDNFDSQCEVADSVTALWPPNCMHQHILPDSDFDYNTSLSAGEPDVNNSISSTHSSLNTSDRPLWQTTKPVEQSPQLQFMQQTSGLCPEIPLVHSVVTSRDQDHIQNRPSGSNSKAEPSRSSMQGMGQEPGVSESEKSRQRLLSLPMEVHGLGGESKSNYNISILEESQRNSMERGVAQGRKLSRRPICRKSRAKALDRQPSRVTSLWSEPTREVSVSYLATLKRNGTKVRWI